jgi:hypothetical protein
MERADGMFSWAGALSSVEELLKGRTDTKATKRVHWDIRSVLPAALPHFSELGAELELLGSGRNMDLMEDQVDAL